MVGWLCYFPLSVKEQENNFLALSANFLFTRPSEPLDSVEVSKVRNG